MLRKLLRLSISDDISTHYFFLQRLHISDVAKEFTSEMYNLCSKKVKMGQISIGDTQL